MNETKMTNFILVGLLTLVIIAFVGMFNTTLESNNDVNSLNLVSAFSA